jgi:hypothetical protein
MNLMPRNAKIAEAVVVERVELPDGIADAPLTREPVLKLHSSSP